jgi:D-alanyl-D-alanine carboxypeptidase
MSTYPRHASSTRLPRSRRQFVPMLAVLLLVTASGCGAYWDLADADGDDLLDEREAAEPGTRAPSEQLQSALNNLVERGAPGAIAYSRHGTRVSTATSGVSDLKTRVPISTRDRFRGGSTTKSFTATVILQLVAEGRLRLDDTLESWLPGRIPRGAEISVRQLLSHTSGIANNAHDPDMLAPYMAGNRRHYWSPLELVGFSADQPLAFEPGEGYLYSNTNYHLLGLIIEAATKHDAFDEIRDRLVRPLHLENTDFPLRETGIRGRHTHGYHFGPEFVGSVDTTLFSPAWAWTAGAIVTTVRDLANFNRALLTGRLLDEAQMVELLTTVAGDEGPYGLGVVQWDTPCGPGWGHEGDVPGYHTVVLTSRDGKRQAVIHINSDDAVGIGPTDPDLSRAVIAAYCPDL